MRAWSLFPLRASDLSRLFLLLIPLLPACRPPATSSFQGYVEAEYVHVGSPLAGTLTECRVRRGDAVRAGDPLFTLEHAAEEAAVEEASRRVAQADARLANLRKGARPTELGALSARTNQARVNLDLWNKELARREQLARDSVIASTELDLVRSQRDAARAALEVATAELETARLGAREDEIAAVEAERKALEAALARAKWAVDQKSRSAPVAGTVHDTLFRPGEVVPAGTPVVSLLPPENLKIRFFVPEPLVSSLPPKAPVEVRVDGLPDAIPATVTFVATQPEFTPPVIYSRETRSKLVYLVEASLPPAAAARLRPGQPVDVRRP